MSNQRIKIPRTSDRHIAATFRSLAERYQVHAASVSALGLSHLGAVNLLAEPDGDWKALLGHDSQLIETLALTVPGLSVTYVRGGQYQPEQKSAIFDEIILSANNQQPIVIANKLELVAFLNKELHSFDPSRLPGADILDAQSQLTAIHHGTLERLENLNEYLVRQSADFRKRLEEQYDERVEGQEKEARRRIEELEAEYKSRLTAVDERDASLQTKLAAIDDRNNTHVRREIRDKMLNDVKQRISQFGVSIGTERKRLPVLVGIAVLIAIFVGLLTWTANEISNLDRLSVTATADATDDKANLYFLWIRFTLFSLGLVGALLYYIKWQNKWAEQHANSEFQLQQFYIDVNRANWVIESCLEWKKETNSPIPSELLESITSGLFVNNQGEPEKAVHPADELASALMGSASRLKLRAGEHELEFDKPGKIPKKLSPQAA
jgi:hypothetical protein